MGSWLWRKRAVGTSRCDVPVAERSVRPRNRMNRDATPASEKAVTRCAGHRSPRHAGAKGRAGSPLPAAVCQRTRSDFPRRRARSDAPYRRAASWSCQAGVRPPAERERRRRFRADGRMLKPGRVPGGRKHVALRWPPQSKTRWRAGGERRTQAEGFKVFRAAGAGRG